MHKILLLQARLVSQRAKLALLHANSKFQVKKLEELKAEAAYLEAIRQQQLAPSSTDDVVQETRAASSTANAPSTSEPAASTQQNGQIPKLRPAAPILAELGKTLVSLYIIP